jgi:hypothetical protein
MGHAPLNHLRATGAALDTPRVESAGRSAAFTRSGLALCLALAGLLAQPVAQAAVLQSSAAAAHPSRGVWVDVKGAPAQRSAAGAVPSVQPTRFRATTLDRASLTALVATAPTERSRAAKSNPLVISLPNPAGGFERFALSDSPVMEDGLAAKHPEIKTYAGQGIDDAKASLRMSVSPLGVHVSVLSPKGSWYVEPYYHLDESLYASYYRADLTNVHGTVTEGAMRDPVLSLERGLYHAADTVKVGGLGFAPGAQVTITVRNTVTDYAPRQTFFATASRDGTVATTLVADPYKNLGSYEVTATDGKSTVTTTYQVVSDKSATNAVVGSQLRTYRLALLTDPTYATYFGGSANVTAAKVALVNRITQVYEAETSIRLLLIAGNDALNLDTAAMMTGANGPCGGTACFTTAQAASCGSGTLTRNRVVIGLLVGASNYDIGHIAVGTNGGGLASLGVVGGTSKAQGCTGVPTPVGDYFAVDYVAHEMGHQFAGNHTFNGTVGSCTGGNRNAGTSVEPGSGSSVMAYAGICSTDNLQPHSDAYWSQRSFDEITTYTSAAETNLTEIQNAVMTGYATNGLQFQLRYNGNDSAAIVRGTNFTTAGVQAAIQGIAGWPAGGTVTVSALGDTAFTLTFGGTLAGVNVAPLQLVNCTGGCTGYVGEITKGGSTTKGGTTVTATGNTAPVVTVAGATYTIPVRTPFALTGSATDADNDVITYMWEQNDRGSATGTGLISNTKTNGPLFRQFGTLADVPTASSLLYNSPGENIVGTNPTRVFPDLPQILANNTNAETGVCPTASATPTTPQIDCFSEFLPTAAYVGFAGVNASPASLNFRLTARDGKGGVSSANTQLILAAAAGPFLVTSPNAAVTVDGTSTQTVSWAVAGTDVAPVSAANVKITLSTDGGLTFPYTLAASTANNGSKAVVLPNLNSSTARVKVEAVGNVFFDVSNANFTIRLTGDVDGSGVVDCADLAIVKASMGKSTGQPGFDARADVNNDGVVNVRDLAYVSQRVAVGTQCVAPV